MRQTPCRAFGSRPVVGSSRNSTPGVTTSEAAMSSRRRMPPEYDFTCLRRGVAQVEGGQKVVGTRLRGPAAKAPETGEQQKVLAPGQILVERRELARHGDRAAHRMRLGDEIVAHDAGGAFVRRRQRCQHAHQRGLAGAVRPEDREDRPARHLEVDAGQRPARRRSA